VLLLPFHLTSRPTPIEGLAERREAYSLRNVARVRRDATLARHGPLPVQPEGPPLGAPPWRVGPFPPFRSRHCRRVRREGHSPPGTRARPRELAYPCGYEPRRRHIPLRLQDRF